MKLWLWNSEFLMCKNVLELWKCTINLLIKVIFFNWINKKIIFFFKKSKLEKIDEVANLDEAWKDLVNEAKIKDLKL